MKNEIEIDMHKAHQKYRVDITMPYHHDNDCAMLTIVNSLGEQLLKMELLGSKHHLELASPKFENCNIKIETTNNVTVKKIS